MGYGAFVVVWTIVEDTMGLFPYWGEKFVSCLSGNMPCTTLCSRVVVMNRTNILLSSQRHHLFCARGNRGRNKEKKLSCALHIEPTLITGASTATTHHGEYNRIYGWIYFHASRRVSTQSTKIFNANEPICMSPRSLLLRTNAHISHLLAPSLRGQHKIPTPKTPTNTHSGPISQPTKPIPSAIIVHIIRSPNTPQLGQEHQK